MIEVQRFHAIAPSNIALLKYWGKQAGGEQWPANASLSLTLHTLHTATVAHRNHEGEHQVTLNGQRIYRGEAGAQKIFRHLDRLTTVAACSNKLTITTKNSFPTACGIASSASGFAALTIAGLAACYGTESLRVLADEYEWTAARMADLARLGSGSACRSFWGGFVQWSPGSRPDAQTYTQVYDHTYWPLWDTVVLVASGSKPILSSAGHEHAWSSPLFAPRLAGMAEKLQQFCAALTHRDLGRLGPLLEQEALEMHGVMMSAEPSTRYFGGETAAVLAWLRRLRHDEGLQLYFTLDAGPNIHILGEHGDQQRLHHRLAQDFPHYPYLCDSVGAGPQLRLLDNEDASWSAEPCRL